MAFRSGGRILPQTQGSFHAQAGPGTRHSQRSPGEIKLGGWITGTSTSINPPIHPPILLSYMVHGAWCMVNPQLQDKACCSARTRREEQSYLWKAGWVDRSTPPPAGLINPFALLDLLISPQNSSASTQARPASTKKQVATNYHSSGTRFRRAFPINTCRLSHIPGTGAIPKNKN